MHPSSSMYLRAVAVLLAMAAVPLACGQGSGPASAGSNRGGPADSGSVFLDDAGTSPGEDTSGGGVADTTPATDTGGGAQDPPPDRILRQGMVGRATAVIDGDTIHLTVNGWYHRVRLQGVNSPECEKVLTPTDDGEDFVCSADQEWWGLNAQRALAEHLAGKDITVSCDRNPGEACPQDDFDRFLAFLRTDDGDVGQWLARNGHAFSFTKFASTNRALYCDAEDAAIADGVGMWTLGSVGEVLDHMNSNTQDWYADRDRLCAQAQGE